jgi:phage-related protein
VAVVIGEAAVAIRADASGTADEIQDQVGPAAEKAGQDAGDKLGDKLKLGIAGAGVAIGAGFLSALESAALGDKLAAQLGLSADQSAVAGGVAGELYANAYGDSLATVNDAVGTVMTSIEGMRGASSADLEAVTANALNFATAMDVDVATAAQSAGLLVKTGLADSARDAFDLMTVTAQEAGPAMVEPIMEAANEYGTNFAAMGFSGEQAMALLVDASRGGEIALDKAGDAVKEFGIRATDLGDTGAQDALEAIGLNGEEMANRLLAGGDSAQDAFTQIVSGLQGIDDPAEQASQAVALFGTPLEDIGKDKIPAFLDSMSMAGGELEGVAGAADRMGATLNDNASTNLTSFTRGLQTAFVDILGGQVIPKVETAVTWLRDNFGPAVSTVGAFVSDNLVPPLQDLATWLGENEGVMQTLAGVVTAVIVPALGVWAARTIASAFTNTVAWFTTAAASGTSAATQQRSALQVVTGWVLMGAQALIQGVRIAAVWTAQIVASAVTGAASFAVQVARVIAGWVLMGAQSLIQAGRMAAAWFIALGPVGWVIAAVIGLVALIVANWDTVVSATTAAWDWVTGKIAAAWAWITGIVTGAAAAVWGAITGAWNSVTAATSAAWDAVTSAVSAGIDAAVSFLTGLPGRAVAALSALGSMIAGVATAAWQWFSDAVGAGINTVIGIVQALPGRILGVLSGVGSLLVGAGRDLIQGFVNGISGAASFVGDVAGSIWRAVRSFINAQVIDRLNNLLEFTIAGVTVNPPDIPRLHSGGVFDPGGGGEGLALLRSDERVATPEQRVIADNLLAQLLDGTLPAASGTAGAPAAGGVQINNQITQLPGEDGAALAARVTQGTVWNLSAGVTRTVGATS